MILDDPPPSSLAACSKLHTARRGDWIHTCRVGSTGQVAGCPCMGSRMMVEQNEDAALFGLRIASDPKSASMPMQAWPICTHLPGLTEIVGSLQQIPSTNFLLLASATISSHIAFCNTTSVQHTTHDCRPPLLPTCVPYDDSGRGALLSLTTWPHSCQDDNRNQVIKCMVTRDCFVLRLLTSGGPKTATDDVRMKRGQLPSS